jgi:tetratricopeptide (TPR) repeat protein
VSSHNFVHRLKSAAQVVPFDRIPEKLRRQDSGAARDGLIALATRCTALVARGRSEAAHRELAAWVDGAAVAELERAGELCRRLGDAALAHACWVRLRAHDPDHLRAGIELGIAAAAGGDGVAARTSLEAAQAARAAGREIDPETRVRLATLLLRCGDPAAAEAELRTVLRTAPLDARALGKLGHLVDARGDRTAARRYLTQAARVAPDDPEVRFDLGATLGEAGDWDEAAEHLQAGLARQPDCLEARYNLGAVRLAQGRFDVALGEFRRVLRQAPEHREALHATGVCYLRKGQHERARRSFESLVRQGEPSPRVLYALAVCYNALDLPRRAVQVLEPVADAVPDPRRAHRLLGVCWDKLGDPERARAAYRRAGASAAAPASAWIDGGDPAPHST